MAYDKDQVYKDCLKFIEEEKLCFFDELSLFVPPTIKTLYDWKFHESEDIKNAILKNRLAAKRKLKKQWQFEEAAPVLQLAVFKLMADEDEFSRLTTSKNDVKADMKGGVVISISPLEGCEPIKDETNS